MEAWLFWMLFAPLFGVAMYLLYQRGYAVTKSIMALPVGFDQMIHVFEDDEIGEQYVHLANGEIVRDLL